MKTLVRDSYFANGLADKPILNAMLLVLSAQRLDASSLTSQLHRLQFR